MFGHPLLDHIDSTLMDLLPQEFIDVRGKWSSLSRRSYASKGQVGSGSGPFVDVVDHVWDGHLTGADPLTGMAFLRTRTDVYWVKAAHASSTLAVKVSLRAYADYTADRMTFFAGLGDVVLPSVSVATSASHCAGASSHRTPFLRVGWCALLELTRRPSSLCFSGVTL